MQECSVAIVGAGPTGMMLAAELTLAGVDVQVLERRPDARLAGSRAGGLQSRTIEIFDQRGIADRFLAEGTPAQVQGFGGVVLDISDFPTRHPYGLALWQNRIEEILATWVGELGVTIRYGCDVVEVTPGDEGVIVRLADGHPVHARYVVACDGGRSLVRKACGIAFEGWDATVSNLIAEVEYVDEPEWGLRQDAQGVHGITRLDAGGGGAADTVRVVLTESTLHQGADPTLDDLRAAMREIWGSDFGVHSPTWISRFTDAARQATTYRAGRILLAGDAAHVHYPAGGQGLSLGVHDAVDLGWKLAQVVAGTSPQSLLDSYQRERHPVAARVLQDTLAQVALRRTDPRSRAVASSVSELLSFDAARKSYAARLSGLGVRYDLVGAVDGDHGLEGAGSDARPAADVHPLVGRRMPDLDLLVDDVPLRTFTLLHEARPLFLGFDVPASWMTVAAAAPRVRALRATTSGPWVLPDVGAVPPPRAVLVRPDGYVAWAASGAPAAPLPAAELPAAPLAAAADDSADASLRAALHTWFGGAGLVAAAYRPTPVARELQRGTFRSFTIRATKT